MALSIIITSCGKDAEIRNTEDLVTQPIQQQIINEKNILEELLPTNYSKEEKELAFNYISQKFNLNKNEISSSDCCIFTGKDVIISYKDILEELNTGVVEKQLKAFTQSIHGLITRTTTVTIAEIDGLQVTQDWRNALGAAIYEWNDLGGDLFFRRRIYNNYFINRWTRNNTWIIAVNFANFPQHFDQVRQRSIASASPPIAGRPGHVIFWNTGHNDYLVNNRIPQQVFAMMHEIGHSIGLRHTDIGNADPIAEDITGLSSECSGDGFPNSLMRTDMGDSPWLRHTDCDIEVYLELY